MFFFSLIALTLATFSVLFAINVRDNENKEYELLCLKREYAMAEIEDNTETIVGKFNYLKELAALRKSMVKDLATSDGTYVRFESGFISKAKHVKAALNNLIEEQAWTTQERRELIYRNDKLRQFLSVTA